MIPRMRASDAGLRDLVKLLPFGTVMVEVGSYAGESALIFAHSERIDRVYCVDNWKGGYDAGDLASGSDMQAVERLFDLNTQCEPKIVKIRLDSETAADIFKTVDFVYLDGDHSYHQVLKDITIWTGRVRKGGYIGGHDFTETEGCNRSQVCRAVLDSLGEPDHLFSDSSWLKKSDLYDNHHRDTGLQEA